MSNLANRRPSEVSNRLGVSASTLRRWSQQFSSFLSCATDYEDEESHRHRRYTDEDLATLITVKGLLTEGYTYDQVRRRLQSLGAVGDSGTGDAYALVASQELPTLSPAVTVLADTLHTVADAQQLLLNSQQSNRDLLSVAIQDNFNLKAENTKLRDRMLELERSLSEAKRQDTARWQAHEDRLRTVEDVLEALVQQTQSVSDEPRRGLWTRLFGP
jgi:DNA-binding transcriptional MerR regulator